MTEEHHDVDDNPLRPACGQSEGSSLLAEVKRFDQASLAREYYQSFNVNSKNYMQQSARTSAWIATHRRLLARCVSDAGKGDPAEVREAMDILFGLLDRLDRSPEEVVFFADEGGSWQVGVDWARVLPAWFEVLSATVSAEEYAARILAVLSRHCRHDRDKMLGIARRKATPSQRKALAQVGAGRPRGGRE
ncbi:MAG: hypothetical protein H7A45_06345 [Verrucomicrobiales bacterium]|nr:hypothetical protein [Verrucomicrobiales bacterium]MCP5527635.1 hypothetical protein [Verrucomicrobiales bacterium]